MMAGTRWVVDAFLAELPPRLADYAELPLWRIDRIATLARHVQNELDGNTADESAVLRDLAVAAESLCWHPGEPEAVEQYLVAQRQRVDLLVRQLDGSSDAG